MARKKKEIDIFDISFEAHAPPLLVRIGVVAYAVPGIDDPLVEIGIHLHVLAQHEKRRFGIVLVERRKNPLGNAGCGTVIEGEVDGRLVLHLPDEVRHQPADEFRRFEAHVSFVWIRMQM